MPTKINSWKYPGCKGKFYVRGKNNIIWYYLKDVRTSLKLRYSKENIAIAGEKQKYYENRQIYIMEDQPRTIIEAYDTYKETFENRKRPGTLKHTKAAINALITEDFELIDSDMIRMNIEDNIRISNLLPRSINSYLRSLRAFFNWLIRLKVMPAENPVTIDHFIKTPRKLIELFTDDELKQIFDYWEEKNKEFYWYIKFIYNTAFRKNEAKTLDWKQIWYNDAFRPEIILSRSKYGNKMDTFPLADSLKQIFMQVKSSGSKQGLVFSLPNVRRAGRMFDEGLDMLGIPKKTYDAAGNGRAFHTLRKTRITNWAVKDKLPIIVLEKLTRDNYSTLREYYTDLDIVNYEKYI